jgi:hypothetical protein
MAKPEIFFITPELQQVLDSVPEQNDLRSKLDPFKPYILRWRRQGKTYRKIQQILRDKCQFEVAYGPLYRFVKRRSRPRKAQTDIDLDPVAVQPVNSSSAAVSPVERKPRMSIEERRAQADALRAQFASKPESQPKAETKPLFEYDPDKPLTLIQTKEK